MFICGNTSKVLVTKGLLSLWAGEVARRLELVGWKNNKAPQIL